MIIIKKINELKNIIILLKEKTEKELQEFPVLTPDEILDCATTKDRLLREFMIVKAELDVLMNSKMISEIQKYNDELLDLESNMIDFKKLNKQLLLMTVPIQEMYNDINKRVHQSNRTNNNILNKSI